MVCVRLRSYLQWVTLLGALCSVANAQFNFLGVAQPLGEMKQVVLGLEWTKIALESDHSNAPAIIFSPPTSVQVRNLKKGIKGSQTCKTWCFEARLQVPSESNCEMSYSKTEKKIVYWMAIRTGVHYLEKNRQVRQDRLALPV